jgi:hypothetical protein
VGGGMIRGLAIQTKLFHKNKLHNLKKGFSLVGFSEETKKRRKRFELKRNLSKITYSESEKPLADVIRDHEQRLHQHFLERNQQWHTQMFEDYVGGFWYGNVDYKVKPGEYCELFNDEFKERVRAFWAYRCFECGEPQNGTKLSIHHIHYNKKMCCDGSPRDVIPLCASCHAKTNNKREYWEKHFTELLYMNHPKGKCFFTKEEMGQYCGEGL